MGPFTQEEIEAAASAIVDEMFAPHELPLDEELWNHYLSTAQCALEAVDRLRADKANGVNK